MLDHIVMLQSHPHNVYTRSCNVVQISILSMAIMILTISGVHQFWKRLKIEGTTMQTMQYRLPNESPKRLND